jgi:hypothetical protein
VQRNNAVIAVGWDCRTLPADKSVSGRWGQHRVGDEWLLFCRNGLYLGRCSSARDRVGAGLGAQAAGGGQKPSKFS